MPMETMNDTDPGGADAKGGHGRARALPGRGQPAMRAYNERLVLSTIRLHGALAAAEIARHTGLSAQTISVIVRALERDGLLRRGKPVKGKVGQPSVPLSLADDGAWSLGLKVGRRSADLLLMDLVGKVHKQFHITYAYPLPDPILAFVERGVAELESGLAPSMRSRIAGLGIATPSEIWNWSDKVGATDGEMDVWRDCDLGAAIRECIPHDVVVENDASAACGAELMFGLGHETTNFLYVFIGAFIGGGIVTNGRLFGGAHGNGGALGSMPVRIGPDKTGQLIDVASLFLLEDRLKARGLDPAPAMDSAVPWIGFEDELGDWTDDTARHLAHAIVAASAVIDMSDVIIEGGFPDTVKQRLVAATIRQMEAHDLQGLVKPGVRAGRVGANARAIGAASLPLLERFLLDTIGDIKDIQSAGTPLRANPG